MYRDIAHAVYRRGQESVSDSMMSNWGIWLLALNFILLLPVLVGLSYALGNLYPVLAMVEDPSPPAYEPLAPSDNVPKTADPVDTETGAAPAGPVTASIRSTYRHLKSMGSWRSNLRGLGCMVAMSFAYGIVAGIFSMGGMIHPLIVAPIVAIVLCQLFAAWVHVVISRPSHKRFWQRLPPFKKTFKATAVPIITYFVAAEISAAAPKALGLALGLVSWDANEPGKVPNANTDDMPKVMLVILTSFLLKVFLVIPTHVVLVRVQASLLPEEDETIVHFDRSFMGRVEPAVVGGNGYVSMKDAWATFERQAWIRLIKLYVKTFLVFCGVFFAWFLILLPQVGLIYAFAPKN